MPKMFQLNLAPQRLWQAINPWTFNFQGAQFGLVNIDLGQTPRPDIEQRVLDEVGSYGRQLGRIGEALQVLLDHVKLEGLDERELGVLDDLRDQLKAVGKIKRQTEGGSTPPLGSSGA